MGLLKAVTLILTSMKMRYSILIIILSAVIAVFSGHLLAGCSYGQDIKNAMEMIEGYYEKVKANEFDETLSLYHARFFEETPKSDWFQTMKMINVSLGELQEYEFYSWKITQNISGFESNTLYELQYKTRYFRYPTTETFIVIKSTNNGEWKILGYDIASAGFTESISH